MTNSSNRLIEVSFFKAVIPALAFVLIIIHGFYDDKFKVDEITLWLFVITLIPFLDRYLTSLKLGNLEVNFKSLNPQEQILIFLKSMARIAQITFYKPRDDETEMNEALKHLVTKLHQNNPAKLNQELQHWLTSPDPELKWFASEIIGYFNIHSMTSQLTGQYDCRNVDSDWDDWQLNYLWAHSKIVNNYTELSEFLFKTKSTHNKIWLLDALYQMATADNKLLPMFTSKVKQLQEGNDLSKAVMEKLAEVIQQLDKLTAT